MAVLSAFALMLLGHTGGVERQIENASRALAARGELGDDSAYASLPGQLAALRAVIALRRGELDAAQDHAQQAIQLSPPHAVVAHALARSALACVSRENGQIEEAIQAYVEGLGPLRASRNTTGLVMAYWDMGRLSQIQGRLHAGRAILEECLAKAAEAGQSRVPAYGLIHIALGHLDYEWNDLSLARTRLALGTEQGSGGGYIDLVRQAGLLKAKLRRADGDLSGALDVLGETMEAVQRADVPFSIADMPAWVRALAS